LEYFTNIWGILRPFGTFCVHSVHFSGFGIMKISGNPDHVATRKLSIPLYEEILGFFIYLQVGDGNKGLKNDLLRW
jgi:hypothetical protein